ncbi:DUF5784 family protein [Halospeciosus flavus]|uniref:DUF5784 family protein n=1 Tax=Halospeciosus flavus TaxID=3032283 RepID=A0ABD5Z2B6_9EURY|nr:DUF5784 family protein [Halospeciosus flavus]
MAKPLRFRRAIGGWNVGRVRSALYADLDANIGATMRRPWFEQPSGYEARRFEMDNGDVALFCWASDGDGGYWLGNTETPQTLWRTDKYGFDEVPYPVARWAQRELLAQLREEEPWLEPYDHLAWFFLPVFLSKDGRESTRTFFRDHAAGFPDAARDEALQFYEDVLSTGVLDDDRHETAGKLGTPDHVDLVRMRAAMAELNAVRLLVDAGYDLDPEHEVSTGHSLDFRVERDGEVSLVEVTRPSPPARRNANTPTAAVRETAATKAEGQLEKHGGGATLFVDCSSFVDDDWAAVRGERPDVGHHPAVVYRVRPSGHVEGYTKGSVPVDLPDSFADVSTTATR